MLNLEINNETGKHTIELFEKFRTDKADGITIIKMTEEV